MSKKKPDKTNKTKQPLPANSNGNAKTAPKSRFSPEEEAIIQAEVNAYKKRLREEEIEAEIRSRIQNNN